MPYIVDARRFAYVTRCRTPRSALPAKLAGLVYRIERRLSGSR